MKLDHPTPEAYSAAAWLLLCEPAALRAVGKVESGPLGAFLDTGEPTILYERHVFHRLTEGKFDSVVLTDGTRDAGVLSLSSKTPGGYGPSSIQHAKLSVAATLDREAALRSCSWGLFQILGVNHARAGYPDLQRFITAAYRSVDDHLRMLVGFIRSDTYLLDALRVRNWQVVARLYNGTNFSVNHYDAKMAAAYADIVGQSA